MRHPSSVTVGSRLCDLSWVFKGEKWNANARCSKNPLLTLRVLPPYVPTLFAYANNFKCNWLPINIISCECLPNLCRACCGRGWGGLNSTQFLQPCESGLLLWGQRSNIKLGVGFKKHRQLLLHLWGSVAGGHNPKNITRCAALRK